MFKLIALLINIALSLLFLLLHSSPLILLSPLFHLLLFTHSPACYVNHCSPLKSYHSCEQCGLPKWVRMKHCYRCGVCIHKFDHHCILLDICIGETNQKYFILFLWSHLLNSSLQIYAYLSQIKSYVSMDQRGNQHLHLYYYLTALLIIFFALSASVVGYLCIYHTYLISHNETTYQMKRRYKIVYLKYISRKHPFSRGVIRNWVEVLGKGQVEEWSQPKDECVEGDG